MQRTISAVESYRVPSQSKTTRSYALGRRPVSVLEVKLRPSEGGLFQALYFDAVTPASCGVNALSKVLQSAGNSASKVTSSPVTGCARRR